MQSIASLTFGSVVHNWLMVCYPSHERVSGLSPALAKTCMRHPLYPGDHYCKRFKFLFAIVCHIDIQAQRGEEADAMPGVRWIGRCRFPLFRCVRGRDDNFLVGKRCSETARRRVAQIGQSGGRVISWPEVGYDLLGYVAHSDTGWISSLN